MSVEFEEEPQYVRPTFTSRAILGAPEQPALTKFLYGNGLVKSEKQAGQLLIGIIFICLTIALFLFFKSTVIKNGPKTSPKGYLEFMQKGVRP